jgi:hypothetical protein
MNFKALIFITNLFQICFEYVYESQEPYDLAYKTRLLPPYLPHAKIPYFVGLEIIGSLSKECQINERNQG